MSDFWKLFFVAFGIGLFFSVLLAAAILLVLL